MPRITCVYTRGGDDGTTSLGGGQRVSKDSLRIRACGAVDELNTSVGAALAGDLSPELIEPLKTIQNELFHLGADLCIQENAKDRRAVPGIEKRHVRGLEALMDDLMQFLPPLENFVLPGGSPVAASLHQARAVCRRAERDVISLSRRESVGPHVKQYLNRLSDALFVMARFENLKKDVPDVTWDSRA
ncbi:MAG: cob(I)yrinic acid a,c-diamide adenosyltransferase [Acidobacteriota bacterium]